MSSREPPSLSTLAPELIYHVLSFLAPRAILALAATSSHFYSITASNQVWRDIVEAIIRSDGQAGIKALEGNRREDLGTDWYRIAEFLCRWAPYMGYAICSLPTHTSRVLHISLSTPGSPLSLTAYQLTATSTRAEPSEYPANSMQTPDGAYYVLLNPPAAHPYANHHISVLSPSYSRVPLFTITPKDGIRLSSPTGVPTPHDLRMYFKKAEAVVDTTDELTGRRNATGFFALIMGRTDRRDWPTPHLLSSDNSIGAIRGTYDWIGERGVEKAVREEIKGKIKLEGWEMQATRMKKLPSTNSSSSSSLSGSSDGRRGVPPNGGPAILYDGREEDPDSIIPPVLIRTASSSDNGVDEFVFRLREPRPVSPDDPEYTEEIVRGESAQEFYPIHPPAAPVSFDDPLAVDIDGDILASSLEGVWVGTYGPHGLEFGHLSVSIHPVEVSPFPGSQGRQFYERTISFVKLTGDQNVPSGQKSWTASLPLHSLPLASAPLDPSHDKGSIPSIDAPTLFSLSHRSEYSSSYDWDAVTVPGAGQIALAGFVQSSWTEAEVLFVRSSTEVSKGDVTELRDSVEEIRMRWESMSMVSVFKRVRI